MDYASWVQTLHADDIAGIYGRYAPGKSLADDVQMCFGHSLDEETINESHQIVVVAGSLDESTERIIQYLNKRNIAINVLCFQVFKYGEEQLISRAWLITPFVSQVVAAFATVGPTEPWNGEFYHSFGVIGTRSWGDAVQFGFICEGGKAWYSGTLQQISPGGRVWVNVPRVGYVGVGRMTGHAQPAAEFKVSTPDGEKPVLAMANRGTYYIEFLDNSERCDYFVP